jgi:hypothetical protein
MKSRHLCLVAGIFLMGGIAGFSQGEPPGNPLAKEKPGQAAFTIVGTIRYLDIEGGGWVIAEDGGKSYQPQNLSEEFKKDGLRVRAKVQRVKDAVGILQAGEIVRIIQIEKM